MKDPTAGYITELSRLDVPVKKAKTVPSIDFGVIFANKAIIGNVPKDMLIAPKTTSVKINNA